MPSPAEFVIIFLVAIGAVFSILAFIRASRQQGVTSEQVSQLLRAEFEQVRQAEDGRARALREELGGRLDAGIKTIDERAAGIGASLNQKIVQQGEEAAANRETLRQMVEAKLDSTAAKQVSLAKEAREEAANSFQRLNANMADTLNQIGAQQKERLDNVSTSLKVLTEKQEKAQDALKQTVEGRLDAMRSENSAKLDEMRKTVDEKLQATLETRLGESFNRVVEQLERVHKGIGEMQSLATNVGDLKRVLSNVKVRGTYGENQLAMLLEQFLSPEQYIKNAQVKEGSLERVEFAIKFPGHEIGHEVLLSVDAKFPQDDYERLVAASEAADIEAVMEAGKALEARIKTCAKSIREKYINPPLTTDFAILFLPTESLYAEILRRPGVFEGLQRDYHVTLTGPATLGALLNALQMGFRSLAIEKRSSEVWKILGAVRNEFGKYNEVVDGLARQLSTAAKSVEKLGTRTRVMDQKLRTVEKLPDATTQILLGTGSEQSQTLEENEEVPEASNVLSLSVGGT